MKSQALNRTAAGLLLLSASCATAAPKLTLTGPATVEKGKAATLQLRLTGGTEPYGGFNARIALPKGVTVTGVIRGALLPGAFVLDHRVSETSTRVWLAVVGYSSTASIAGADGALLDIGLQVSDAAVAATHAIEFATTNTDPAINSSHALSDARGARSVEHTVESMPLIIAAKADTDGDGIPDATDPDDDNDGTPDGQDAFPLNAAESLDTDGDRIGNNADPDDDNDGVLDAMDNCPRVANPNQADGDRDKVGDVCDRTPNFCEPCLPDRGGWRAILK